MTNGTGAYYATHGYGAAEAPTFNATTVWADVAKSNECYSPTGPFFEVCKTADQKAGNELCANCNLASKRAATAIQGGLKKLGFDPGVIDGIWGKNTSAAWNAFAKSAGVPAGPGLISKEGVFKMGEMLNKSGTAKASMLGFGLAALVIGGIGLAAFAAKKKKSPGYQSNGELSQSDIARLRAIAARPLDVFPSATNLPSVKYMRSLGLSEKKIASLKEQQKAIKTLRSLGL